MKKLQEGDKLESLQGYGVVVVGVCGEVVFYKFNDGSGNWLFQDVFEKKGWKLAEPEWKLEERDKYYYPDIRDEELWDWYFKGDASDKVYQNLSKLKLVFKTKEEAIAKAKQMLGK